MIHHSSAAEKDQIQHERECHWDDATAIQDEMNDDFRLGKGCGTVQGICYDLKKLFFFQKQHQDHFTTPGTSQLSTAESMMRRPTKDISTSGLRQMQEEALKK